MEAGLESVPDEMQREWRYAFQPAIAGQWAAFPKEQPPLRPAQARNPYRIGRKRTHF